MSKRAILTGATGFIGRWLVRALLQAEYQVTAVVRSLDKGISVLPSNPQLQIVECPMEAYGALPKKLKVQPGAQFYHLAWDGVSGNRRNVLSVQMNNVQGCADAIQAAVALQCSRFIGLGSIMEVEARERSWINGVRLSQNLLYGEAKHMAHLQTRLFAEQNGIEHLWAVLTNAYGEYENSSRFINTTLRKMLRNEPLEFTSGTQNYDFIHVEDTADALVAIGERGRSNYHYIIGGGAAKPLRSFIEELARIAAPEQALQFGAIPYTGAQLSLEVFSISQLTEDTGFSPKITFSQGIQRTVDWLRREEMYREERNL